MSHPYWDKSIQCLGNEHEKCTDRECFCPCHKGQSQVDYAAAGKLI